MIALIVGAVLAVGAVGFVLYPIFVGPRQTKESKESVASVGSAPVNIDDEIEAAVRAYREKKHDRCAACGTPVARDARYCASCGNRLPA